MIGTDRQKEKIKDERKIERIGKPGITESRSERKRRIMPCGILLSLLLFSFLCAFCKNPISVQAEEIVESAPQIVDLNDTSGALLPQARRSEGISLADLYEDAENWYGDQLTAAERKIYNAIATQNTSMKNNALASLTDSTVSCDFTIDVSSLDLNINDDDYYLSVVRAIHAYIRDYGEMYWVTSFSYTTSYDANTGNVSSILLSPKDYYSGVRADIGATDTALAAAVQKIAEYDTDYEKIKAAHDYVVDLITYGNNDYERAHTITGGLLEKYGHTAVCECYAKLFRLLCTKNDIPCVLVTGGSTTDSNGKVVANHMWNYVQLNGYWYLVDCTWDDDSTSYTYFLAGANTAVTDNKTASENHLPVGVFSSSVSYSAFTVPTLSQETYGVVQEISLDQTTLTLDVGNTGTITATALPTSATNGTTIKYTSSNTSVVTVNDSGKITAAGIGTAEITAYSEDYPSIKAVCTVTVQEHAWVVEEVLPEATCVTDGTSKFKCSHTGCSETKTETVPATGEHIYGEWKTTSSASDQTDEIQTRTCSGCGKTETRTCFKINKTETTLDVGNTVQIIVTGVSVVITEDSSVLSLTSSDASVVSVKSCVQQADGTAAITLQGNKAGKATIKVAGKAGSVYANFELTCTVTVQNHEWDSGKVQTAATCTTTGSKIYTCTHDGCTATKTETGVIAKLGHNYQKSATKAATCRANGSITYTCTRCKATKTETIAATGHQFVADSQTAATCTAAGTTTYRCTHTGCTVTTRKTTAAATGHTGAWKTVKQATAVSTGRKEYRCTVCGKLLKSKTIAKLKAKVKLNVSSLPMQVKKSTAVLKVASMTTGDSVASWKSSNTKIVAVNSKTGKLTAKKKGTATITVTMKSGAKATCRVKVQKGTVKTTKLTVKPSSVTLKKGKSLTLSVTRTPLTSGQKVTYKSSNKKVAAVNSKGKITAKKKGTAIITVTSGSKKKTIKVKVK